MVERAERAGRGVRWLQAGGLVRHGRPGSNRVAFSGRIGRRPLRAGRHRARLVATDAQRRRSVERRASFRIVGD